MEFAHIHSPSVRLQTVFVTHRPARLLDNIACLISTFAAPSPDCPGVPRSSKHVYDLALLHRSDTGRSFAPIAGTKWVRSVLLVLVTAGMKP